MQWTALKAYVDAELALEGNAITPALLVTLANAGLGMIAMEVGTNHKVYNLADLTASGAEEGGYLLPASLTGTPQAILLDGAPLEYVPALEFEQYAEGLAAPWREVYTVIGNCIKFSATDLSTLKIYAFTGLTPLYTYLEVTPPTNPVTYVGAPDGATAGPMASLPPQFVNLPAHWALWNFKASSDVPVEVARVSKHKGLWDLLIGQLKQQVKSYKSRPYRF